MPGELLEILCQGDPLLLGDGEFLDVQPQRREEQKKATMNPSHQAGESPQLSLCRCRAVSPQLPSQLSLSLAQIKTVVYNNVCLLLARTTGNGSPKEYLASELKIQISAHKSIFLLLAIPLCIRSPSRSLR